VSNTAASAGLPGRRRQIADALDMNGSGGGASAATLPSSIAFLKSGNSSIQLWMVARLTPSSPASSSLVAPSMQARRASSQQSGV